MKKRLSLGLIAMQKSQLHIILNMNPVINEMAECREPQWLSTVRQETLAKCSPRFIRYCPSYSAKAGGTRKPELYSSVSKEP